MRAPPHAFHRRSLLVSGTVAASVTLALPFRRPSAASARTNDAPPASQAVFATDIRLPGLLHTVVARPPLPGWRLAGLDPSRALRVNGVVGLIRLAPWGGKDFTCLGGVAVLACDTWSALRGRDALVPTWEECVDAPLGSTDDRTSGCFVPVTAEPLMEPPSATARAEQDRCTVWTSLCRPEPIRRTLAALLGLTPDTVTLHTTASAVAADRVSNPAYAIDAARLSRAMGGAPVSLTWTREDDIPFRDRPVWT